MSLVQRVPRELLYSGADLAQVRQARERPPELTEEGSAETNQRYRGNTVLRERG